MLRVGLIGYGYWGRKLARALEEHPDCSLEFICDTDADALKAATAERPNAKRFTAVSRVSGDFDAVVIATPPRTHAQLVDYWLQSDKHVLCAKPLAFNRGTAARLAKLAEGSNLVLAVDFTYLYSAPVRAMKASIEAGALTFRYLQSTRANLGKVQRHGAIWDLAPHDFAILTYLFGETAVDISAVATAVGAVSDVHAASINVHYPGAFANVLVSWLSPVKIRRVDLVGKERTLSWDDLAPPVGMVTPRLIAHTSALNQGKMPEISELAPVFYRSYWCPLGESCDPLGLQVREFVSAARGEEVHLPGDGPMAIYVTRMLEAADRSAAHQGEVVKV